MIMSFPNKGDRDFNGTANPLYPGWAWIPPKERRKRRKTKNLNGAFILVGLMLISEQLRLPVFVRMHFMG